MLKPMRQVLGGMGVPKIAALDAVVSDGKHCDNPFSELAHRRETVGTRGRRVALDDAVGIKIDIMNRVLELLIAPTMTHHPRLKVGDPVCVATHSGSSKQ